MEPSNTDTLGSLELYREVSSFQGTNNTYLYDAGTWSGVLIRNLSSFQTCPLGEVPPCYTFESIQLPWWCSQSLCTPSHCLCKTIFPYKECNILIVCPHSQTTLTSSLWSLAISVFTYCKWSKTGGGDSLRMRLSFVHVRFDISMMHHPNCMSVVIVSHHLLCWLCLLLCTCTCDSCLSLPSSLPSIFTTACL